MSGMGRGSRTSSPKSNSSRHSSPSPKQATKPNSPEEGQVIRPHSVPSNREQGIDHQGKSTGKSSTGGSIVNYVKKNRKAVQKYYKSTGVPITPGEPSEITVHSVPLRTKIGTPHLIGDELGTPSNKGSSFFLSASHNGVRDFHRRVTPKKQQNSER
ncbi:hypothetical protein M758_6G045300 [Ceratodon purpureus]|nr:hypothetical protein M758_6G045300 [Ceratodon purpureus]